MATRDTGGQSQSGKSRSGEEIEDVTVEANPEVAERHAELTEDVEGRSPEQLAEEVLGTFGADLTGTDRAGPVEG